MATTTAGLGAGIEGEDEFVDANEEWALRGGSVGGGEVRRLTGFGEGLVSRVPQGGRRVVGD